MKNYQVIIIGGGPAGLSAGIYLSRFRIKTIIIDSNDGRSGLRGTYHNVMGFPDPIERNKLRELGAEQAKLYGTEIVLDAVNDILKYDNKFRIIANNDTYLADNIIFCTGIHDNWPKAEGYEQFIGCSLHSCPICAGYESIDKRLVIIGNNRADGFALEMLNFTDKIVLVGNGAPVHIRDEYAEKFKKLNIPVYSNKVVKFAGQGSQIKKVILDDGTELEVDIVYSAQGSHVKSELAAKIGVQVNDKGYIVVNNKQETNIEGIYAAGDVSSFDYKQVVTALYEGHMAARSIFNRLMKNNIDKI